MLSNSRTPVHTAAVLPWKWLAVGIHDMAGADRLGNPAIDFPICIAFGDRDFFGTEGAEEIVRKNKHFRSGRSQLISVENCTHNMQLDKPEEMASLMTGFFEGNASGRFEERKRTEVVLPEAQPIP